MICPTKVASVWRWMTNAHAGFGYAILAICDSRFQRALSEGSVTLVDPKVIGARIVGDENIRPSIAVHIESCKA